MDRNPHPLRLLTQSRNSAGERVRIALNLKGLAYEYVSIAAMEPKDYREINPQGLMPALMVGESVFAQSTAILEYLEEVYPARPLLPSDPVKRAEVRAFASLISSDTHPLCNYRIRKYLANELGATDTAILAWYRNLDRHLVHSFGENNCAESTAMPVLFRGWAGLGRLALDPNDRQRATI
jgi:maleylpyruvate isomerase